MADLAARLDAALDDDARAWWQSALATLDERGPDHAPVLLPQLPRKLGRDPIGGDRLEEHGRIVDLGVWRACDVAGAVIIDIAKPDEDTLVDWYRHGDTEERTIVMRSLALRPITDATVALLGEAQRTNISAHVEACCLDSNVVARAVADGGPDAGFKQKDFHRLVLKMAFSDMPVSRLFGGLDFASEQLSTMLQDFANEREAATRVVWTDTYRFIARAPAEGTAARLIGGIEHGDDDTRLAAAEGLERLAPANAAVYARERLGREKRPAIRAVLERVAAQ